MRKAERTVCRNAVTPSRRNGCVLAAARVTELVEGGSGTPVAPSGRTFKEWVSCADEAMWKDLFAEALVFAGGSGS